MLMAPDRLTVGKTSVPVGQHPLPPPPGRDSEFTGRRRRERLKVSGRAGTAVRGSCSDWLRIFLGKLRPLQQEPLEGFRIRQALLPHLLQLPQQLGTAEHPFVPKAHEPKDGDRGGAQETGGEVAPLAAVRRLAQSTYFAHLRAGREAVRHGAEERAREPGLPGRAPVAQVVQQGQKVEVLEAAGHRLNPG